MHTDGLTDRLVKRTSLEEHLLMQYVTENKNKIRNAADTAAAAAYKCRDAMHCGNCLALRHHANVCNCHWRNGNTTIATLGVKRRR